MKRLLILGAVATLVAACGPKQNAKPDPLVVTNDSLSQVIAAKDSIINDAFNSIGEIAASIDRIAEHERLVTAAAASGNELSKPMKERVAENITAISELLDKNRAAIARLQVSADKLKEARVQIGGLERLITQLQEQLDQKNTQLASLTDQVKALKVEIAALGHTVTNLEQDKTELQGAVAEQDAQAAGEPGKHRQSRCTQQQIDHHCGGSPPAAQHPYSQKNPQGLEGEWNGCGNGNPGTDSHHTDKQTDICHVVRFSPPRCPCLHSL